jgi:hypothetical protein
MRHFVLAVAVIAALGGTVIAYNVLTTTPAVAGCSGSC